jgi:hypothetical protein
MGKSMRVAMEILQYRRLVKSFGRKGAIENIADVLHYRSMTVWTTHVWRQYLEPADLCHMVIGFDAPDCVNPANIGRITLESNCNNRSAFLPVTGINPFHGYPLFILHLPVSRHQREAKFSIQLDEQLLPLHACGVGYLKSLTLHPTANIHFPVMPALSNFWSGHDYGYQSKH